MAPVGYWLSIGGYILAGTGSILLFVGTPADVGMGQLPTLPGDQAAEFFANQRRAIARRARQTKWGFGLLIVGMFLQLAGFVATSRVTTAHSGPEPSASSQRLASSNLMRPDVFVTAATVLFGFLFAGYWWALNRELRFKPEQRHFKYGYALLLMSMAVLSVFGIIQPLRNTAMQNAELLWPYRASVLVIIGVFGYMLTEFGHYQVFQAPKYTTWQEHLFFWFTMATWAALLVYWCSAA
jgi:hypothetical protein